MLIAQTRNSEQAHEQFARTLTGIGDLRSVAVFFNVIPCTLRLDSRNPPNDNCSQIGGG
jgi:hypothetical protein